MVTKMSQHYKMEFYDTYVIIERNGQIHVDSKNARETLQIISDHYKGKPYVIISNRTESYTVNAESYTPNIFNKVKGIAVVSQDPSMKSQAILEQLNFKNSFAFFENLEEARNWAENFF